VSDIENDDDVEGARSQTEEAAEPIAEDGLWPDDMVVVEAGEEGPGGVRLEGDSPRGDGLHGPSLWHAGVRHDRRSPERGRRRWRVEEMPGQC
jgi:hypothetical protein